MTMEWHAQQMQAAFAARRYALARWHCRIFTGLARKRAAKLFNDGMGGPAQADDIRPSATPSPYHGELRGE